MTKPGACDDLWELACKTTGPPTLESASNFGAFPETQPGPVSTKPLGWWLDLQRFIMLPFANEEILFLTWDNLNIIVSIVVDVGPVYATCATWTMMVSFQESWPFRETPVFCRQFTFWQGLLSYMDMSFVGCPPSQMDTNGNLFKKCSGFHGW